MAPLLVTLMLLTSLVLTGVNAADPLGLCTKSTDPIRACSDSTILEQLFQANGPIFDLHCNFTLAGTVDNVTLPYTLGLFTPSNDSNPDPYSSFSAFNTNPAIKFQLLDKTLQTILAPSPDFGLEGEKYRETMVTSKNPNQYGKQGAALRELTSGTADTADLVALEGRMKWECIDGAVTLILMPPEGSKSCLNHLRLENQGV